MSDLLLPRRLTHLLLLAAGALLGEAAWLWLDLKPIAYLSGVAGPYCLLCASAVWGMRDKVDEVADPDHADNPAQLEQAQRTVERLRRRFMPRAAIVAGCALAAASAAIAQQVADGAWHWMVVLGGVAVGEATFGYLLAMSWEDQLRSYRARRLLEAARRAARDADVAMIRPTQPIASGPVPRWDLATDPLATGPLHS